MYNARSRDECCDGADKVYSAMYLGVSRGERPQLKHHICFQAGSRLVDIHGVCRFAKSISASARFPFPPFHLVGVRIDWRGGPSSPQSRKPSSAARLGIFPHREASLAKADQSSRAITSRRHPYSQAILLSRDRTEPCKNGRHWIPRFLYRLR
jgi:hypothetical protein